MNPDETEEGEILVDHRHGVPANYTSAEAKREQGAIRTEMMLMEQSIGALTFQLNAAMQTVTRTRAMLARAEGRQAELQALLNINRHAVINGRGFKSRRRCSRCGMTGHNRLTCCC